MFEQMSGTCTPCLPPAMAWATPRSSSSNYIICAPQPFGTYFRSTSMCVSRQVPSCQSSQAGTIWSPSLKPASVASLDFATPRAPNETIFADNDKPHAGGEVGTRSLGLSLRHGTLCHLRPTRPHHFLVICHGDQAEYARCPRPEVSAQNPDRLFGPLSGTSHPL